MNALTLRPFSLYFWTNTAALLGTWIQKVGLGWLAWEITESTFWTSFVSLALMAPVGVIGPFIAVYAENWDMRRAMLITKILMAITSFFIFILQWYEMHTLHSLVIASLILGVLSAVHHPIRLVFISIVVTKPYLASAIGLNSASWNMSRIVGPALSGYAIVALGLAHTFGIAMLCYLPLICALLVLRLQERKVAVQNAGRFMQKFIDGGRVARTTPLIFTALSIVGLNSFFVRGVLEIQPAIVGQILNGDSYALAVVTSAAGLGSLLGSGWIGVGMLKPEGILKCLWPMLVIGLLASISLYYATELMAMAAVFVVSGFTATVVGIGAQTLIQLEVSENYRARVMTWWSTVSFGSLTGGGIIIGFFGDLIPIEMAIAIIMVAGGVLSALALIKLPLLKAFRGGK
ncbi:MAG: MFS transporter [Parvularculales bacterium]